MGKKKKRQGIRSLLANRYKTLIGSKDTKFIPTGFKPLDTLLGGGFAKGQYSLVAGYEGSGKTTLMLQLIKSAQDSGLLPIILDTEFAIGDHRLQAFGIKVSTADTDSYGSTDALYLQPESIERVSEILDDIAQWKYNNDIPVDQEILIVWDSLTSTPTNIEIEESVDNQQPALVARIISKFVKKHAKYLEPLGITLIVVGQYREKIEMNAFQKKINPLKLDAGKTIPGGNAIKFKAYQLLTLEPRGNFELAKGKPLGRIVKLKTLKNKATSPQLEYEAVLTFTKGFHNFVDMYNALLKNKYITKSGAQTYCLKGYKEKEVIFKKKRFFKILKEDKGFKEQCVSYYREICDAILNPVHQMDELLDGGEFEEEEHEETQMKVVDMIEEIAGGKDG